MSIKDGKPKLTVNTNVTSTLDADHLSYTPNSNASFRQSHPLSPSISSLFEKHKVKVVRKRDLNKGLDAHRQPLVLKLIPPLSNLQRGKFEDFSVQVSLTDSQDLRVNFATICECITSSTSGNDESKMYIGKVFLHSWRPFSNDDTTQLEIGDEILQIDNDANIYALSDQIDHGVDRDGYITTSDGDKVFIENPVEKWQEAFDAKLQSIVQNEMDKASVNSGCLQIKVRRHNCIYEALGKRVVPRVHKGGAGGEYRDSAVIRINDNVARTDNIISF